MFHQGRLRGAGLVLLGACMVLGIMLQPLAVRAAPGPVGPGSHAAATGQAGQTAADYLAQGYARLRAGDYTGAVDAFTHAIALDARYVPAYVARANAYLRLARIKDALADLSRAIALTPGDPSLYLQRAHAEVLAGDTRAALHDATRAIQLQPASDAGFALRGNIYVGLHNYAAAIKDYSSALRHNPANSAALYWRGVAYFELYAYHRSAADFSQLIARAPDTGTYYVLRGQDNSHLGACDQAMADANHGISLDPTAVSAWVVHAQAYRCMKNDAGVIADARQILRLKGGSAYAAIAYTDLCQAEVNEQEASAALADANRALVLAPRSSAAYECRARAEWAMGDTAGMFRNARLAAGLDSADADAWFDLGVVRRHLGDGAGAISAFQRAAHLYYIQGDALASGSYRKAEGALQGIRA